MVVLPTPPLPITMIRPWPGASSSASSLASGWRSSVVPGAVGPPDSFAVPFGASSARSAGKPTMLKGLSETVSRGSPARAGGMAASAASAPRSSASAIESSRFVARKTPFTTSRWLPSPRSRSSADDRAASDNALASGRATRTTVVETGSASELRAASNRVCCIVRPLCGPRHAAPRSLCSKKLDQAWGRLSSLSVCPVGAVSNITWSNSDPTPSSPARRPANSSKAAISTVRAPDSSSRIFAISASDTRPM